MQALEAALAQVPVDAVGITADRREVLVSAPPDVDQPVIVDVNERAAVADAVRPVRQPQPVRLVFARAETDPAACGSEGIHASVVVHVRPGPATAADAGFHELRTVLIPPSRRQVDPAVAVDVDPASRAAETHGAGDVLEGDLRAGARRKPDRGGTHHRRFQFPASGPHILDGRVHFDGSLCSL